MKFMIIFSHFVNNDIGIIMNIELNHYFSFVHFHKINSYNNFYWDPLLMNFYFEEE